MLWLSGCLVCLVLWLFGVPGFVVAVGCFGLFLGWFILVGVVLGGFLGLTFWCGVGIIYFSWLDLVWLMVWLDLTCLVW